MQIFLRSNRKLPDDPKAEWSVSLVSSTVLNHINEHSINMDRHPCCVNTSALQPQFAVVRANRVDKDIWVLTFDGSGVSSHANHVAIYKAVRHLASTGDLPKDCVLLSLETVGLLRKYLSFLDLPFSWLLPSHFCCVVGSKGYKQAKAAMLCHRTQLLWFRYLYITFSRYMLINTFQTIPQGPKNLKIY